jgi:uncharacterized protein DUF4386
MNSNKKTTTLPGLLFLLATVTGGFGLFYIRSYVIVPGDAAATVANIRAAEFLYRAAIVATLFSQLFMFFFGLSLFHVPLALNQGRQGPTIGRPGPLTGSFVTTNWRAGQVA